jgi:hypothetical protein
VCGVNRSSAFAASRVLKFKSKIYCDRLWVGQFVLVSGPLWSRWPDFTFWVTITFFLLYVGRPLWREDGSAICSAVTQVQVQVQAILRPTASRSIRHGGPWPDFNFLCLTITFFFHVEHLHPYPHEKCCSAQRPSQKSKSTITFFFHVEHLHPYPHEQGCSVQRPSQKSKSL